MLFRSLSFLLRYPACREVSFFGDLSPFEEHLVEYPRHPMSHFDCDSWNHLTSFSAHSPILLGYSGRPVALAMAQGCFLRELHLSDKSLPGKTWHTFLAKISLPNLTVFEFEGQATLKTVCAFLDRHCKINDLTLGSSISSRVWRPKTFVLPQLTTLRAPARLALPFIRVAPTLAYLTIKRDAWSTGEDVSENLLSLVGTSVRVLSLDIDEDRMNAFNAPYTTTCLRFVRHLSISSSVFTEGMFVSHSTSRLFITLT